MGALFTISLSSFSSSTASARGAGAGCARGALYATRIGSDRIESLAGGPARNGCSGTPKAPCAGDSRSCARTDARHAKITTISALKRNPDMTFPAAILQNAACTGPNSRLQDYRAAILGPLFDPGLVDRWRQRCRLL